MPVVIPGFVNLHNLKNPGFSRTFYILFPGALDVCIDDAIPSLCGPNGYETFATANTSSLYQFDRNIAPLRDMPNKCLPINSFFPNKIDFQSIIWTKPLALCASLNIIFP